MEELITFLSFNLKRDFFLSPRHSWRQRRELAARLIRDCGATIIGVQELSPGMRMDLARLLGAEDYSLVGFGRYRMMKRGEEHSDIILKNPQVSVSLAKTFWLSHKPELRSRAYYAIFPRICTVAEVYIHSLGRSIRVFNTHLDHICGVARLLGIEVILSYMEEFQKHHPLPCVIMGDLNCKPQSRPIQMLKSYVLRHNGLGLFDAYDFLPPEMRTNTLHNFTGKVRPGGYPIDYMFLSPEFSIQEVRILTESVDGRYPSDHFPLMVKATLPRLSEDEGSPANKSQALK